MTESEGVSMTATAISIDFQQKRNRLTTFFRLICAIPAHVVTYVYGLFTCVAIVIAWIALLITGRYPQGLYGFVAGYLRMYMRYVSYLFLATDDYPPFGGGAYPDHQVQVTIPERQAKYSRLLVLLRIVYALPLVIFVSLLVILVWPLSVIAWITILLSGRLPGFIADYDRFALGWLLRCDALVLLLTERY
jgi:hypothetical protein